MDLDHLLSELKAERDRLDRAIAALAGSGSGRAGKAANGRRHGRRHMSAAARKRISEGMRKRWAERKKRNAA